MNITISLLTVLLIITLLLSPFITPFPALFLFLGLCFYLLGQAFKSSPEEKRELEKSLQENIFNQKAEIEEEEYNKINVIENEDHIIVTETRKIMKKDLTYSDFQKYNVKNANCIKDCISFKAPSVKNNYEAGHKKCTVCDIWLKIQGKNCPCCSSLLKMKKPGESTQGNSFI